MEVLPCCGLCLYQLDSRIHFILSCPKLSDIRDDFMSKLVKLSPIISLYVNTTTEFLLCILDPFSPKVPESIRKNWTSEDAV